MVFQKSERIARLQADHSVKDYLESTGIMNKATAQEYLNRLSIFSQFLEQEYGILKIGELINKIKEGSLDPYVVLGKYSSYLRTTGISTNTLKQRVVSIKNFLEFHDIEISPKRFTIKVKLPRSVRSHKEAISKEDIVDILNQCSDIRLKTYVLLLASTGMRASEALSIRVKDLDFESDPPKVSIRGEYTKTKTDRIVFLTDETRNQIDTWLKFKYRTRRNCHQDKESGRSISEYKTPNMRKTDPVFGVSRKDIPDNRSMYVDFSQDFSKTLDRIGKGEREDRNENRRQITLHSFRRFVKTTISDLGYQDYSEFFLGHAVSTYWRKKDSEKAEIFKKVEPYLTFLNIHQLERQGADIQSKIDELELLNQALRDRDKSKDEQLQTLSNQFNLIQSQMQNMIKAFSGMNNEEKDRMARQLFGSGVLEKVEE